MVEAFEQLGIEVKGEDRPAPLGVTVLNAIGAHQTKRPEVPLTLREIVDSGGAGIPPCDLDSGWWRRLEVARPFEDIDLR